MEYKVRRRCRLYIKLAAWIQIKTTKKQTEMEGVRFFHQRVNNAIVNGPTDGAWPQNGGGTLRPGS